MSDAHARNIDLQREWYGEPLGDRLRRLLARLQFSQAQLADVVGLSAPMLSQLMSGQRAKISNPAVLARLLRLEALAEDARWDQLSDADKALRLEQIRRTDRSTLAAEVPGPPPQPAADPVAIIQGLLRTVASAGEIDGAAHLLEGDYPDLAEALRVLGTGRTPDARAYYARITGGAAPG